MKVKFLSLAMLLLYFFQHTFGLDQPVPIDDFSEREPILETLVLPGPEPGDSGKYSRLSFGEKISFEQLGPIILNKDGTTRRIANWDILTEAEKEASWRIIAARNKKRTSDLNSS